MCNSASIAASRSQRLLHRALRLCQQAYEQGGLLSNCDLAEMLNVDDSRIAGVLAQHERSTNTIVPRRATLHDVGTGLTHKRIICWKRYADGKEPHVVARETYHSLEAVDRYLGQYDRVRHCRLQGLTPEQTAHALACSLRLVQQYLAIDDLLRRTPCLTFSPMAVTIDLGRREDRALLRSNPSARLLPKHGRESPSRGGSRRVRLFPLPCFGLNALNLRAGVAPTTTLFPVPTGAVRHMSGSWGSVRR